MLESKDRLSPERLISGKTMTGRYVHNHKRTIDELKLANADDATLNEVGIHRAAVNTIIRLSEIVMDELDDLVFPYRLWADHVNGVAIEKHKLADSELIGHVDWLAYLASQETKWFQVETELGIYMLAKAAGGEETMVVVDTILGKRTKRKVANTDENGVQWPELEVNETVMQAIGGEMWIVKGVY